MKKRYITKYEVCDLPSLGWIRIFAHGEENTYFLMSDGTTGFIKYDPGLDEWPKRVEG